MQLISRLYQVLKQRLGGNTYGWSGNYSSWDEALKHSTGYDAVLIAERVKEALIKVKNGEAAFERDSVVFETHEYSWPLLAGLTWVAAQRNGKLSVLDFGGSMGSHYFQYRKFLSVLDVKWNVVEQENFVRYGRQYFEDGRLKFYDNIRQVAETGPVDVCLLSSVLPYVKEPYAILIDIIEAGPAFIIFDKMPFLKHGDDRITVQKVHPSIYQASYPAWFFNEGKFFDFLQPHYSLIEKFEGTDVAEIPSVFKGFIFQRKQTTA